MTLRMEDGTPIDPSYMPPAPQESPTPDLSDKEQRKLVRDAERHVFRTYWTAARDRGAGVVLAWGMAYFASRRITWPRWP